jgi:hypothetical protein
MLSTQNAACLTDYCKHYNTFQLFPMEYALKNIEEMKSINQKEVC